MTAPDSPVYVLGAGGHSKVLIRTLQELGYRVEAVFDDDSRKRGLVVLGVPIAGSLSELPKYPRRPAVVAVGDNRTRKAIAEQIALPWLTVVHPTAYVDETAELGEGTVVFAGAVVQVDARVGKHAIINTGATVDHDCLLGDYVHICPGAHLAGEVAIGPGSLVGTGASVIPCRQIGACSTIGAGAAVIHDVPDDTIAIGVPARAVAGRAHRRGIGGSGNR